MNPHAEAADLAIRQLANSLAASPTETDLERAAVQLAGDELRVARMLRHRRAYAKAAKAARRGLDRLST